MNSFHFTIPEIPALPGNPLKNDLQHRINNKTKPLGSLGRLEALALQIGLIQNTITPQIQQPQILVFAGDHGAARAGVSAYPQEVTWQMVQNFLNGGAAINVLSQQAATGLAIIDAGVNHDFDKQPGLIDAKIAHGTANYIEAPAMTAQQCHHAMARGRSIMHDFTSDGCNLVGFGEMGIGNTASASLITHCLIRSAHHSGLGAIIGRGAGLDDAGLTRKQRLLEQALKRGGTPSDPMHIMAEYGGFEIAMIAGAMLGAAEKRITLLVDGFIVTSALLLAHALSPNILPYCIFAHRSKEPGHTLQLDYLQAEPLLDLSLRVGEGTGAALAVPLVRSAVAFLNDMASFDSAGISH